VEGARRVSRTYREAEFPPGRTPWREANFTVVDLETTGLDPSRDEIISFGTVAVSSGRVIAGEMRSELIRPERMPEADTIRIHGLRESDLAGAPPLEEALPELLDLLAGRVLVAHVASIETGFLRAALERQGLELRNPVVDTAGLFRELRRLRRSEPGETDPVRLSELARSLGLPVHRPHHAVGDALTTAQAFLALATHLERFHPVDVAALIRLSRPPRHRISLRSMLGRFGPERLRR
jgi:DNA polymerase III subunit epsilon